MRPARADEDDQGGGDGVIFAGQLGALSSGYTRAGLDYLMALVTAGFNDISIYPRGRVVPWATYPRWTEPLQRLPDGRSRNLVLHYDTPDELANVLRRDDTRSVAMSALDADRIARWAAVGISRQFERLIVPSKHSEDAALHAGVKIPIRRVPQCVGPHLWEVPLPVVHKAEGAYVFYFIGSWHPRKNPEGVLRAYCRAFPTPEPGVCLNLKLTAPDPIRLKVLDVVREEAEAHGGAPLPDDWTRPDVVVQVGLLSEKEIRELHAWGDCYVSAHRGEAWGVAMFEAAALGRPVIATGWSGCLEYLSEARGDKLVPYTLAPVTGMGTVTQYGPDQHWAEPDLAAMSAAMQAAAAERRRDADPDRLRRDYSWAAVGPVLRDALGV